MKPYRLAIDQPDEIAAARAPSLAPMLGQVLEPSPGSRFHGPGFSIFHRGRDGSYLLAAAWYGGHNLTNVSMGVQFGPGEAFRLEALPDRLFACVWELAVYEFERTAWMRCMMMGRGLAGASDYLETRAGGLI